MTKRKIDFTDYADTIAKALPRGILLTTKEGDKINSMAIGWGTLGINWGLPVFVAYVRDSRFTKGLLDRTGEFTVNVPVGEFDKNIIAVCGRQSGRDTDKLAAAGLTAVPSEQIAAPGIREMPLTLECKVIYAQRQDMACFTDPLGEKRYAPGPDGKRDMHTCYFGQILDAYIIED